MAGDKDRVTRNGLENIEKASLHCATGLRGERRILREEYDGKEFYGYVKKQYLPEFPSDRVQAAIKITSRANDGTLLKHELPHKNCYRTHD